MKLNYKPSNSSFVSTVDYIEKNAYDLPNILDISPKNIIEKKRILLNESDFDISSQKKLDKIVNKEYERILTKSKETIKIFYNLAIVNDIFTKEGQRGFAEALNRLDISKEDKAIIFNMKNKIVNSTLNYIKTL